MEINNWAYYSPDFESDNFNTEMMKYSPWSGHRFFAYDLVANFKPQKIVELGSYYGCSAFSFLQAIKDFSLESEFYGIDTWNGDDFTSEDYREDIYGSYKKVQDSCFSDSYAHMLRMTFDEAVSSFDDASIDLLHIDGSHTYEDVKHDFYTWKNKVKNTGVILFHDVSDDELFGEVMGSHLFWEELKSTFPYTVEFPFSFGLGILFFDKKMYEAFRKSILLNHYQQLVNQNDVLNKDVIRKYYFERRDLKKNIESLERQVQISQEHLNKYEKNVSEKDAYIRQLEVRVEQLTQESCDTYLESQNAIKEYQRDIDRITNVVAGKDSYIDELKLTIERYDLDQQKKAAYIEELTEGIYKYSADEKIKKEYIDKLETSIRELNEAISNYQKDIETIQSFLEGQKQDYKNTLEEKEGYIKELELSIDNLNKLVDEKDKYIDELRNAILLYEKTCSKKNIYIDELKQTVEKYRTTVEGKEGYITELLSTVDDYQRTTEAKEQYINDLQKTIETYIATVSGKDNYIFELESRVTREEEEKQKIQTYVVELEEQIRSIIQSYQVCRSELEKAQKQYSALLRKQTEIEFQNIDLQRSIENTYEVLGRYKKEMSQNIVGRHFIKKVEKKNEQS